MTGFVVFLCGLIGLLAAWYAGYRRGKVLRDAEQWLGGRTEGLTTAYHTAKAALDLPAEGKPGRSIVGRAIVRKLKALAEGTDTNNNGEQA